MAEEKKGPKEVFYEEHVRPLIREVFEKCKEANISFYSVFSIGEPEEETAHVSSTGALFPDAPIQLRVGLAVSTGEAPIAVVPGLGLVVSPPSDSDEKGCSCGSTIH